MGIPVSCWRCVYRLLPCLAALAVLALAGCPLSSQESPEKYRPVAGKYDVRILRDTWGVPHVFGKRDADTVYGLAWAHCEDDWANIEDGVLLARGQLASARGREYAKFDYLVALFQVRKSVEAQYETALSAEVRALVEAYAEGVTHFASAHRDKMPHVALPVTGKEVVAGAAFKAPFFYGLQNDLGRLLAQEGGVPISPKGLIAALPAPDVPWTGYESMGSNAWAVAPSRSADGFTRLAINSHQPWTGPVAWYEAHLHSEEGWDMIGGTFPGAPFIFKGHDQNKGWCHTINRPDLVDVYDLEINHANPNQYKLDGEWRDLERATARIKVRLWGAISWTFKRELLWSVHGPAIRTPGGVCAIRFAGYGEIAQLEQWYRMNKARNLDEFMAAMRLHTLASLNTLYADRAGNLYYAYNARFPVRKAGYDWSQRLPGNTSDTLWQSTLPFDRVPQVLNPASGFVQSCNNSPYHTTVGKGNPVPQDFDPALGVETRMTNRALRALAIYGGDESITRDEFYAYKYDKTYDEQAAVSQFVQALIEKPVPDEPLLKQAVELLRDWDRGTDQDNPAAALAILAGENHPARNAWGGDPFDPVKVLRKAAEILMEKHGRLDVPWREMMRLRRGAVDLGLGGGPDCLRAIDPVLDKDGRFKAVNGDCYYLMVEWDREGRVRSEALHQFGSASIDPESPHYADQAPLFAAERMRPTWLTEEDIRAHLEKEYRPGEGGDPWYR